MDEGTNQLSEDVPAELERDIEAIRDDMTRVAAELDKRGHVAVRGARIGVALLAGGALLAGVLLLRKRGFVASLMRRMLGASLGVVASTIAKVATQRYLAPALAPPEHEPS